MNIGDFVDACFDRDVNSVDYKVYEVIYIKYNFNKYEMTLKMRYVREADEYIQGFNVLDDNLGLNYCTDGGTTLPSGIGITEYRSS